MTIFLLKPGGNAPLNFRLVAPFLNLRHHIRIRM